MRVAARSPDDVREIANEPRGVVGFYLLLLSWACWVAAAFSFFAIAGGLVTPTIAWSETAFGLFVFGFVLRHAEQP